jgi:hypothetical protein
MRARGMAIFGARPARFPQGNHETQSAPIRNGPSLGGERAVLMSPVVSSKQPQRKVITSCYRDCAAGGRPGGLILGEFDYSSTLRLSPISGRAPVTAAAAIFT